MIVCDASPLISLARIGKLNLLKELYGRVIVPDAVWTEVVEGGRGSEARYVLEAPWISRQSVTNRALVEALRQTLDAGEAEAIVLGLESNAELVLMDERHGRSIARRLHVRHTGLIGALREAKHRGLIRDVKPLLDVLRDEAGFYIAASLYERILSDEGE